MRQPFLPTQPSPARSAHAFSITGAMSDEAKAARSGARARSASSRRFSLAFITAW